MLRPLSLMLIAVTVLLAVVTATGRVLVAWLPQLEPRLNTYLAPSGVEVMGLTGRWHLLNPVVHVNQLRFRGGRVSDVTLEMDVLESALHSALIARHLSAAQVELSPQRDATGHWYLGKAGSGGGGGTALEDLLRYSDGIRFPDVRIRFGRADVGDSTKSLALLGEIHARGSLANAGQRHSGEIVLSVEDGGSGEIRLAYNLSDAWFGRPTSGELAIDADQFVIAPAFGVAVGGLGATIDRLHGQWSFSGRDSAGSLALTARDLTLPTGGLESVDVAMRGSTGRLGRHWNLAVDQFAVAGTHGSMRLDKTVMTVERGLTSWTSIEAALPAFDAQLAVGIVRDAAVDVRGVETWLGGLDPRGHVEGAKIRYDFEEHALDYEAGVSGIALENWKGVPYVRNATAKVAGTERSVEITLAGDQVELGFLDYYEHPNEFQHLEGSILIWFVPGYLAVQGHDIAGTFGDSTIHGQFTFGRPTDELEQRLLLALRINDIDGREGLGFVPRELPQSLRDGLDQAILGGRVDVADLVYHGHLRTIEGLPMRQAELRVELHDGTVRFHPDWPPATGVAGQIEYTALGTVGRFDAGDLVGLQVADADVFLPLSVEYVDFHGKGRGDGESLRKLIDQSPLTTWLTFVKPEWTFAGPFDYAAQLRIPISSNTPSDVDLKLDLDEFTAALTDLKVELGALRGKVHYRYPNEIDAEAITGRMFERPARFSVTSQDGVIRAAFEGRAAANEITDGRGLPNPGLVDGEFDFAGEYRIRPGSSEPSVLVLKSDLVGVTLGLPAALGKDASVSRPSMLTMVFANDHNRLDFRLGDVAQGWLRIADGGVRSGSIGIGVEAEPEHGNEDAVTIEGELASLDLTDRLRGEEAGFYPSFPWGMNAFKIGHVAFQNIAFDNVVADVWNRAGTLQISVTAPDVEGSMEWAANSPPSIDLHYLRLPAGKPGGEGDPLASVDPRGIIDLDVLVQSISLGEENYGSWRFDMRRSDQGVAIENLVADVKGLHIEGDGPATWTGGDAGRTHFKGRLQAGDLATVLPQWKYAPSLETETARMDVDVGWPGSPLNFSLPNIEGKVAMKAEKGRFVDLGEGSGAVRIFSLLNFAAIAKRMTLDFSDVFGKGISFDEITATVMADRGVINFVEPMAIDGTGGDFRINGTVNLLNGTLDNEMVVTLPVSSSLPWYAAYLGFVNPIAAGAVLVGERLFRNQIDNLSSAKYKVTGTLQNPEVNFEQVFSKVMTEPSETAAESAAPQDAPPPAPPPAQAPATSGTTPDATQPKDKDA
ncbi:MAG TPA: AsmA-like C-terminal region-containing protein [Pseudomonadales bacterium]|nr:AsmA-like C-terminal region-containing protein [Pseudomonadales bacterium]